MSTRSPAKESSASRRCGRSSSGNGPCKEARRRYDESRRLLLDLDELGARVEPGPLEFRVTTVESRQFSRAALEAILGSAEVERLLGLLTPTVSHRVVVGEAGGSVGGPWDAPD